MAPSFTWRPDEGTSVTLLGLFQKDNTASGQQLLPAVASLHASPGPRLPDSRFLGEPTYDTLKTEQGRARCCSTFFGHKSATGSGPTTPIDAYAPVYGNFVAPDLDRDPTLRQWQFGFYVQDQIRYADRVSLVLGARRDRAVADVQGSRQ